VRPALFSWGWPSTPLFLLFVGLLVPFAWRSTGGGVFPGLFALGTTRPRRGATTLFGRGTASLRRLGTVRRLDRSANRVAGAVLALAGLNDTLARLRQGLDTPGVHPVL
jgi:hypothetical protein